MSIFVVLENGDLRPSVEFDEGVLVKTPRSEVVAVTATNVLADLAYSPVSLESLRLFVEGVPQRPGVDFTLATKTITWIPGVAGFSLLTTNTVLVFYES